MINVEHPSWTVWDLVMVLVIVIAVLLGFVVLLFLKLRNAHLETEGWVELWRKESDNFLTLRKEFNLVHKDYTKLYDHVHGTVNGKPKPHVPTSKEEKLRRVAEQSDNPHEAAAARAILNNRRRRPS